MPTNPRTALRRHSRHKLASRRIGAVVVQAAFFLVVIVALLALVVDVGYLSTVRTEIQRSADAGALAGAAVLFEKPALVSSEALSFTQADKCGGRTLDKKEVTVVSGQWDTDLRIFTAGAKPYDAVQVAIDMESVPAFFSSVMGHKSFEMHGKSTVVVDPRDIMLVLDFSGSMNSGGKVNSLKHAVKAFISLLKSSTTKDKLGFVRYSDFAKLNRQLTSDLTAVDNEVDTETAAGWTNIGQGMEFARLELMNNGREGVKKLVVLMTDGIANRPLDRDPHEYITSEANLALQNKIPIVSISFGDDADQVAMQEVATITKSKHFHVSGWSSSLEEELTEVLRKVAADRPIRIVE